MKINDPASDLATMAAVLSSNFDMPIEGRVAMTGEVGLSGEIRPVGRIEQRIAEAEKLGFHTMLIPKGNSKSLSFQPKHMRIIPVNKVEDAFRILFKKD